MSVSNRTDASGVVRCRRLHRRAERQLGVITSAAAQRGELRGEEEEEEVTARSIPLCAKARREVCGGEEEGKEEAIATQVTSRRSCAAMVTRPSPRCLSRCRAVAPSRGRAIVLSGCSILVALLTP